MNQLNMSKLLTAIKNGAVDFGRDEEGAQVVEYALIIAVVSIALVVALQALTTGGSFSQLVTRIGTCLSAGGTCA